MPGRRNYARERAEHAAVAPDLQQQYAQLLSRHLPTYDRALVGPAQILANLHGLGIRRLNGDKLTWRIVNSWRVHDGCPILRGNRRGSRRPQMTTTYALTAWLLSRFHLGDRFSVATHAGFTTTGSFPASP